MPQTRRTFLKSAATLAAVPALSLIPGAASSAQETGLPLLVPGKPYWTVEVYDPIRVRRFDDLWPVLEQWATTATLPTYVALNPQDFQAFRGEHLRHPEVRLEVDAQLLRKGLVAATLGTTLMVRPDVPQGYIRAIHGRCQDEVCQMSWDPLRPHRDLAWRTGSWQGLKEGDIIRLKDPEGNVHLDGTSNAISVACGDAAYDETIGWSVQVEPFGVITREHPLAHRIRVYRDGAPVPLVQRIDMLTGTMSVYHEWPPADPTATFASPEEVRARDLHLVLDVVSFDHIEVLPSLTPPSPALP